MTLAAFLSDFLDRQRLNKKSLAEYLDVDPSAITQFVQTGTGIGDDRLRQVAEHLGADPKHLERLVAKEKAYSELTAWISRASKTHTFAEEWGVAERAALDAHADDPDLVTLQYFIIWSPERCDAPGGAWLRAFVTRRQRQNLPTKIQVIVLSALEHATIASRILYKSHMEATPQDLATTAVSPTERSERAADDIKASYRFFSRIHQDVKEKLSSDSYPAMSFEVRASVGWIPAPTLIIRKIDAIALVMLGTYGRFLGFQSNPAAIYKDEGPVAAQAAKEFEGAWRQSLPLFDDAKTNRGRLYAKEIVDGAENRDFQIVRLQKAFEQFSEHLSAVEAEEVYAEEIGQQITTPLVSDTESVEYHEPSKSLQSA